MKILKVLTIVSVVLLLSFNAYGNFVLSSSANSVVVSPGGSGSVTLNAIPLPPNTGDGYGLIFLANVTGIPADWNVEASPPMVIGIPAETEISVTVPADAEAGSYTATITSSGLFPHSGESQTFLLYVTVTSECSTPVINIASREPASLWTPNNSMKTVEVSGTVEGDVGCALPDEGTYTVTDEYGDCPGKEWCSGSFTVEDDGAFSAEIPVKASRKGSDKDGREYTIMLQAEGCVGAGVEVRVAHDQK